MRIPAVALVLLPKCGKRKPPSKNYNPYAEFFSSDPSLLQNSRTGSPTSSPCSWNSCPSSPDISSFSSRSATYTKLYSPHPRKSSSEVSSPRGSSASNSPNSPGSVNTPPAASHSFMSPNSKQPGTPKRVLVDHLLELERDRLTEAFRIIDRNRDGKISEDELGAMWKRLGSKISSKELRLMIQEADKNGDGVLDLDEFVEFFIGMGVQPEINDPFQYQDDIRLAFQLTSFTQDGLISAAELQTLMRKLKVRGRKVSAADCAAMIRSLDSDGDGLISFSEFQKLMTSAIFTHNF